MNERGGTEGNDRRREDRRRGKGGRKIEERETELKGETLGGGKRKAKGEKTKGV